MSGKQLGMILVTASLLVGASRSVAGPVGTAFTYQGQLKQDGIPVNDTCRFDVGLWSEETGGTELGVQAVETMVQNGLFTLKLNDTGQFGVNAFNGDARWLDISVSCPPESPAEPLGRQELTPAPYARHAVAGGDGSLWAQNEDGSRIYYSVDNVGIGMTDPRAKLQIGGSIGDVFRDWMDNGVIVGKSGESDGGYFGLKDEGFDRQDTVIAWGDNSEDALRFIHIGIGGPDDGEEAMRINANGAVGIGTKSPNALLHIQADQDVLEYLHLSGFDDDDAGTRPVFKFLRARGSAAVAAIVQDGDTIGSIIGSAHDGNQYWNPAAIEFKVDGIPGVADMPGRIEFQTAPDGGTGRGIRMTIDSNGNVGIGTTGPTAHLEVRSRMDDDGGTIRARRGAIPQWIEIKNNNDQGGFLTGHSGVSNKKSMYIDNLFGGTGAAGGETKILFRVGDDAAPVEAMRIQENGNVGIGASATDRLTVGGAIRIREGVESFNPGNTDGFRIFIDNTNSVCGNDCVIFEKSDENQDNPDSGMAFVTVGQDGVVKPRMTISGNGNVGIGTSSPSVRLHVRDGDVWTDDYGSAGAFVARRANGSVSAPTGVTTNDDLAQFYGVGYDGTAFSGPEAAIEFTAAEPWTATKHGTYISFLTTALGSTSTPERMRIDPSGKVGIGTTDLEHKLEVVHDMDDEAAIHGRHTATFNDMAAVVGQHDVTDYWGIGVRGVGGFKGVIGLVEPTGDQSYTGVNGIAMGGSGTNRGVWGRANGAGANYGIYGSATGGATNVGVWGNSDGAGLGSPAIRANNTNEGGIGIWSTTNSTDANLVITNEGEGDLIRGFTPAGLVFQVRNNGTTKVSVLEITGADLAEKFPVSEETRPGMVVAIDPKHPGQLCVARGVYNRRVAGVVSGANGLSAGVVLGNLPGLEDAPPIAMSGRVWTLCDASSSAIEPGDLLTTSSTPGHAMKVTDHAKAQGAVIGKAMMSLNEGQGLILVLVSLQ